MSELYSNLKVFHFPEKLASLSKNTNTITPPVHVRIKPTNACGHSCWYCAYKFDDLQLGKDMMKKDSIPKDKIIEIIDDLSSMGTKALTFSGGGDPLYYPHLLDALNRLAETEMSFAALTNGAFLKGDVANMFAKHGTWLRISIDAWDDETYIKQRGVPKGEFTTVLNNISNFMDLNPSCYMGISFIVTKENAEHVYESIALFKSLGVNSIKISPCIVSNDGAETNAYHQPFFQSVLKQVARADKELADDHFEIYSAYHTIDDKFSKSYDWCPYLQVLPVIGADLNVYSCQDKAYNLDTGVLGSIKEQSFKSFWHSNKEQFFKINPSRDCNHHCVSNNKNKMILEYLDANPNHLGFV